jgi:hypothetical protein
LEAASIPAAAARLESAQRFADSFANRLALGVAAGLIAVLVHGEAPRLATEELTWRALLGR